MPEKLEPEVSQLVEDECVLCEKPQTECACGQCFPCGEIGRVEFVGKTISGLEMWFCETCLKHKDKVLQVFRIQGVVT